MERYGYRDDVYVVTVYRVADRKRGSVRWQVHGYFVEDRKGTLVRTTAGTEEESRLIADALWADYAAGLMQAPVPPPTTVGELVDRYLGRTTKKNGEPLEQSTLDNYSTHTDALVNVTGSQLPLRLVSRSHVEKAVRTPPKASSQLVYHTTIKAVFTYGIQQGWVKENPAAGITVYVPPEGIKPFLQEDEIPLFLAACGPVTNIRAKLIVETGMRVGEAYAARHAWIRKGQIGRTTLVVPCPDPVTGFKPKGKRSRTIPLSKAALDAIEAAKKMWPGSDFILHAGKAPYSSNLCEAIHNACRKVGVTDVGTHGLRRTFGARLLLARVPMNVVSKMMGHKSIAITEKHYAGLMDLSLAEAAAALDALADVPRVSRRVSRTQVARNDVLETVVNQ